MPESLTATQVALGEQADQFAQQVMLPLQDAADAAQARKQVREGAKAAGFFAMTQPVEFGGTEPGDIPPTS